MTLIYIVGLCLKSLKVVVKLLLSKGANLSSKDTYSWILILLATIHSCKAVVKLLSNKDADINSKDTLNNQTPLLRIAEKGHKAVVELLLDKGADVNSKEENGWMPLSFVHEAAVKLLIAKGADIKSSDANLLKKSEQYTPLRMSSAAPSSSA